MPDQNSSTTTNDNLLMVYFQRRLIKTLHEKVAFYTLADKYPLPAQSGTQMTFNSWRKIAAASATLAEASSNSAVALSSRRVNVTVASYGRSAKITDMLELTSVVSPLEGAMRELEHSAALTLDNVIQLAVFKNVLAQVGQNGSVKTALISTTFQAGLASSFCANTGTTTNSRQFGFPVIFAPSVTRLSMVNKNSPSISARLGPIGVRKAVTRLRRLAVDPFANGLYAGIMHPNAESMLLSNADYKQYVVNYAEGPRESIFKNAPSRQLHGVDIVVSPNSPRYATSAMSCHFTFICGQGALGVTELGGGVEMIVKRPGPQTTSEPFNLNSFVAYKLRAVAAALNPSAGVILISFEQPNLI